MTDSQTQTKETKAARTNPFILSNYCPKGCYADATDGKFQRVSNCPSCGGKLKLQKYVKATGEWVEIKS